MGQHAFLSASSSHRWLECPPSAKLCSEQEDRASPYAQQGTDCHELCAYLVEKSLGRDAKDPTENLTYYDQEMQDCAESYCSYVNEQVEEAKKHCQFCKGKATCRKRAEYNLELARYDFEMPATLEDTEIAAILPRVDDLVSWAADLKEYALQQALSGKHYDGFKVVEGRSVRKYSDEAAVASAAEKAGYDPYEKKLLGITAMSALMGKKKFEEVPGSYITKPQGKPTLVPESDKRPAINTAYEDFSEN